MRRRAIKGFTFAGNPISLSCSVPFEIADGLALTAPSPSQRTKIKAYLRQLGGHGDNCGPFERTFISTEEPPDDDDSIARVFIETKRLPAPSWRYVVVEFSGVSASLEEGCVEIKTLRAASHLTEYSLRLNPTFMLGVVWSNFASDSEYFQEIAGDGGEALDCDLAYLEDLRRCYTSLLRLDSTHPDIARSIRLYDELPDRRGYNELTTLGLFSVLESLLTHNPRGEYDSIGHQIRAKVALLEKRLLRPLDYSCFGRMRADRLWAKLYEFRSRIAHGGKPDFERSLSVLDDPYNVEVFLKKALRTLLRGAMEEPDLYLDLKVV